MIPTVPVGHRRMSSFRNTTLKIFKGKSSQIDSGATKGSEVPIGNPIHTFPVQEVDNVSPTDITLATPTAEAVSIFSHSTSQATGYQSTIPFEINSIGYTDHPRRRESQADTILTDSVMSHFMRETPSIRSKCSDIETITNEKSNPTPARSKKAGAKLRMALSLLRRRSNPNLRRAYVEPIGEAEERETSWLPFDEPLLDPDLVEPGDYAPKRSASSSRKGRNFNTAKSHGFKFTLPSRGNTTRQAIKTPPPRDSSLRPRRATVASTVVNAESQVNTLWNDFESRPRSSQSTDIAIAPEEPSSDSIFSRESAGLGGNSPGGGLFPRPASLPRNWNDEVRKRESGPRHPVIDRISSIPTSRLGGVDRVRPVSFGGTATAVSGYGITKITEAASLENRVKELETKVATLESLTHQQPCDRQALQTDLQTAKDPSGMFQSQASQISDSTIGLPGTTDAFGTRTYTEASHSSPSPDREKTLHALEGLHFDEENKRSTISTVRVPMSQRSRISANYEDVIPSPSSISFTEYTGMVSIIKREQKARKRLESQVAALQEQMATVLHQQLTAQSGHRTVNVQSHGHLVRTRPELHRLHNEPSNEEVPTPDLTPPRVNLSRNSAHLFTSFDGEMATNTDDASDDGSMLEVTKHQGHEEVWETPAEEKDSMLGSIDEKSMKEDISHHDGRTLSLSQLTQRRSVLSC